MSKPDWKDAPEWANYLTMDCSGNWNWHEMRPEANTWGHWESGGRVEMADANLGDWKETLEKRSHE